MTEAAAFFEGLDEEEARWRVLAERATGVAVENLASRSYDGIAVGPLYRASRGAPRAFRGAAGGWAPIARIDAANLDVAFLQACDDLATGAEGFDLVFAGSSCAFGRGLPEVALDEAASFFERLAPPRSARLLIAPPTAAQDRAEAFADLWREAGARVGVDGLRLCFDPATTSQRSLAALARRCGDGAAALFCADGRRAHAAGASEAQELAFVLASGVAALRAGATAGLDLSVPREKLFFRLAADADFLLGLAKFRALRLVWRRIEQTCGLAPAAIDIQADSAWRMMTRRDPWTNVLRVGAAVAAAGLGGADAIVALPYSNARGAPDAAARRLALTTQLVLLHEAQLGEVADPAGGSGAIDALTQDVATRAWDLFQAIERQGGFPNPAALDVAVAAIAATRAARLRAASGLAEKIVGVSAYPQRHDSPQDSTDDSPEDSTDDSTEDSPEDSIDARDDEEPLWAGLPVIRLAQGFETARARADAFAAARGRAPQVLLLRSSDDADAVDAQAFAHALFAAGGFHILGEPAEADGAAGADIVCLCCGADAAPTGAIAMVRALCVGGVRAVFFAGGPDAAPQVGSGAFATDIVRPGCDGFAILASAHDRLA